MTPILLAIVAALIVLHIVRWRFTSGLPRDTPTQERFTIGMTFSVGVVNMLAGVLVGAANAGLLRLLGVGLLAFGIYAVRDAVVKARGRRASVNASGHVGQR